MFVCLFCLVSSRLVRSIRHRDLRRLSSLPMFSLHYFPHNFFSFLSSPITCYVTSPSYGRTLYIRWSSPLSLSRFSSSLINLLYSLLAYLFASPTFHHIPDSSHPQGPFCCSFVIFLPHLESTGVWVVCLFSFLSTSHLPCTSLSPPLSFYTFHTLYLSSLLLCLFLFTSDVVCCRGPLRQ